MEKTILNKSNSLLKNVGLVFESIFGEREYEDEKEISENDILDDKKLDEKMRKILSEGLKEAEKYNCLIQDIPSSKTLNNTNTKIKSQTLEEKEVKPKLVKEVEKKGNVENTGKKQPKSNDKSRERDLDK